MKRLLVFAIALFIFPLWAFAAEDSPPTSGANATTGQAAGSVQQEKLLHYVLGGGLTFGGDTLGTMTYADGSTDSITAGGG